MTFRTRLTLLTCAAIAVTLVAASFAIYALAKRDTYRQVDDALNLRIEITRAFQGQDAQRNATTNTAASPTAAPTTTPIPGGPGFNDPCMRRNGPRIPGNAPGQAGNYSRALDDGGKVVDPNQQTAECRARQSAQRAAQQPPAQFDEANLPRELRDELESSRVELPITEAAQRLAASNSTKLLHETVSVGGDRYRIVSGRVDGVDEDGDTMKYTVQVARPLAEQDDFLHRLLLLLVAVTVIGVAISVVAALFVTGAASQPIHRLTRLTQEIRASRDLSQRVQATGNDDLARLAVSFNAMLDELERSNVRQQRLVDDASHQLRTPLASIRTNMDVLIRAKDLDARIVRDIMGDLSAQVDELTSLVRDLVDLASNVESSVEREPVRLDEVAEEAVRRVRGAFPDLRFETHLEAMLVEGSAERLVRMVQNLLHNAGKWSPTDSTVELHIEQNTLRVVDHGSGVADPEKSRIFERFHRAADARDIPGSGLGLAIVQQVALDHGGEVTVEDTPGGGATFVVRLPPLDY